MLTSRKKIILPLITMAVLLISVESLTTIEELEHFIEGNQAVAFTVLGDTNERYQFIQKTLIKLRYITLKKPDKGISQSIP
jgi:hypothetical protein